MPYTATFKPSFLKDLHKLSSEIRERCGTAITAIIHDPFDVAVKKLGGHTQLYRYRIGDYRLVYYLNSRERKILFLLIAHRKEVYRHLKQLTKG